MKRKSFLIFVLWMLLALPSIHAEPIVEIYNYEGRVSVLRNGKTFQPNLDFTCQGKDLLHIEPESTIDLSLNYLIGIRFFGPAECELSDVEASNVHLKMGYGTAMVNMKPLSSDALFEIETPTTVVSTKNAKFLVQSSKQAGKTSLTGVTVKVGTASVYIKSSSSAVTLLEGQHVEVSEDSFIPSSRNATEEELKPLLRVLSIYIVEPATEEQ